MNKLAVLVFSIAVVVLSVFSTVSAQDLNTSWLEYQNARNLLNDSYAQIDAAWVLADAGWENGVVVNNQQVRDSWELIENAWAEIDTARVVVANTLNITLTDSSQRGFTPIPVRLRTREYRDPTPLPYAPEPTWGSWDELTQAWVSLDQAWSAANSAWTELDRAWAGISVPTNQIAYQWTKADEEWAKINTAWAEINAVWAQ